MALPIGRCQPSTYHFLDLAILLEVFSDGVCGTIAQSSEVRALVTLASHRKEALTFCGGPGQPAQKQLIAQPAPNVCFSRSR